MVKAKSKATFYKAVRPDGSSFHDHKTVWAVGDVLVHPTPGAVGGRDAAGYYSIATSVTDCTGMAWPARVFVVEPVGESWAPHADLPNKVACHSVRVVREVDATLALGPQGPELVALIERIAALPVADIRNLDAAWGAAWDAAWGAAWGAAWDAARAAAWDAARAAARGAARAAAWDAARAAARDAAWDAAWDAARDAAWGAAWDAARAAAWDAAWGAAWDAARAAAWDAAWGAAWALSVRDLIGDKFTQAMYDRLTLPWRQVVGKLHADDAEVSK